MKLYVNGRPQATDLAREATVDDALGPVRRDHRGHRDRAIIGMTCDGVDVFGPELPSVLDQPASDYARIDVTVGDPKEMIADALNGVRGTLPDIDHKRNEVVALFGEGKTSEAMHLLSECVSDWLRIHDVILRSLALLGDPAGSAESPTQRLADAVEPVRGKLAEIKSAVTAQDFVAVADILEYEFDDVGECWRRAVEDLLHDIDARGQKVES